MFQISFDSKGVFLALHATPEIAQDSWRTTYSSTIEGMTFTPDENTTSTSVYHGNRYVGYYKPVEVHQTADHM